MSDPHAYSMADTTWMMGKLYVISACRDTERLATDFSRKPIKYGPIPNEVRACEACRTAINARYTREVN